MNPWNWEEIHDLPKEESEIWKEAAREELDVPYKNKSWKSTKLPSGGKTTRYKWMSQKKKDTEI